MQIFFELLFCSTFFALPIGIGLFLLYPARKIQSNTQVNLDELDEFLILISLFIGMTFNALLLSFLEKQLLLKGHLSLVFGTLSFISILGFWSWKKTIQKNLFFKNAHKIILWTLPIFLLCYVYHNFYIAQYPLRNLFQDTNFLKGAYELSKFQILNPYIVDTYAGLLQTHWGYLNFTFNVDLLRAQWILPLYSAYIYSFFVIFFLKKFLQFDNYKAFLGLALFHIIYMRGLGISNAVLLTFLMLTCLTFYTNLFLNTSLSKRKLACLYLILVPVASVLCVINKYDQLFHFQSILGTLLFLFIASFTNKKWTPYILHGLLIFAIIFTSSITHRFFIVCVIVNLILILLYHFFEKYWNKNREVIFSLTRVAFFASLVLFLLISLWIVFFILLKNSFQIQTLKSFVESIAAGFHKIFIQIAEIVLNKKIDPMDPVETGGGIRIAFYEYMKSTSLSLMLFVFLFLSSILKKSIFEKLTKSQFYFIACSFLILFFLIVSPAPYFYRIGIYATLFAIGGVVLFCTDLKNVFSQKKLILFSLFFLLVETITYIGFSNLRVGTELRFPYMYMTHYYWALGLVFSVIGIILIQRKTWGLHAYMVSLIFLSSIAAFSLSLTGSYKKVSNPKAPITHYTKLELEASKKLITHDKNVILSDPATMSNFKAFTGISSFTILTNFDMIPYYQIPYLLEILSAITKSEVNLVQAKIQNVVEKKDFFSEAIHIYTHIYSQDFKKPEVLKNYIFVITNRTLQWLECESQRLTCDYYWPNETDLPRSLIIKIHNEYEVIKNYDNRILIFRFKN